MPQRSFTEPAMRAARSTLSGWTAAMRDLDEAALAAMVLVAGVLR
jgi:hypothetical protein